MLSLKNRWELLCTDKIIRILIGDNADCQSEGYRLGLPYLRGQDICSLATRFGFPIVYKEDELGCSSRCEMFKAFLLNIIKREMVSNVLAYMFSMTQFDYLTELGDRNTIQEAYDKAKKWALDAINANLFLGKHELKVVNEKFYLVEFQKDIQIEAPVFNIVNMEYIHSLRTRCTEDLSNGNYDSVITKSRTLMEEIFLYVLENEKVNVKMNGDLTQYYGKIKEKYGLNQSSDIDNRINSLFSGLERIVRAIAELRNKTSDSHGAGQKRYAIREHEARLVMNSSITICEYILSIYKNNQ